MDPIRRDAVPGVPGSPEPPAGEPVPPPAAAVRARRAPTRHTDPVLAALFQQPRDLGALERMLLAWSVHPRGAGFDRARWLVWSPARELLAGRLWWGATEDCESPGEALLKARRLASEGPDPERTRELRGLAIGPEHLAGVAH